MNYLLHRFWSPGIRVQLMLWYTVVFALLLLCSGLLLYTQLQTSLVTSLDTALQLRAQQVASSINNENGTITVTSELSNVDTNVVDQQGNHEDVNFDALVRILDAQGHPFRVSPAFRALVIPAVSVSQPLRGSPWQGTVTTRDGQAVRLYSMALTDKGAVFAVIQVGESLAQLQTTLRSLMLELLLIAPFVLLLGAMGSYWLASRAFIPIDRLTRTVQRIRAGDLHQRVPVPRAHDEVYRLALTLNEMIKHLEDAFTRQRRFVADASHELRTPVTVIRNMAEMALLHASTLEEYTSTLRHITTETERLGQLISDLLALARADEGQTQLEQEPVRLDLLVSAVAMHVAVMAAERGITLQVQTPEPITVLGDEARLIQVVMNLLDNALLYTERGGQVTLTATVQQHQARLTVRDTGIGIAPEHLPHIFERFYRVDPARVQTEGNNSGLGLSIVQWVVQAHGGRIAVESQVGQGSTFNVSLPLLAVEPRRPGFLTPERWKAGERAPHRR